MADRDDKLSRAQRMAKGRSGSASSPTMAAHLARQYDDPSTEYSVPVSRSYEGYEARHGDRTRFEPTRRSYKKPSRRR